jgi:hypothetical protein
MMAVVWKAVKSSRLPKLSMSTLMNFLSKVALNLSILDTEPVEDDEVDHAILPNFVFFS